MFMIVWAGIAVVTGLTLVAIVSWLMARRITAQANTREAVADVDTGVSPVEWQRARRLRRVALVCLVLAVFIGACFWALFGGAIVDQLGTT